MAYEVGVRPPFNYWRANLSTSNQIAAHVFVPERAQVLSISCYLAGSSGQAAQVILAVWTWGGALVAWTGQFGSGAGAGGSGRQRWETYAPHGSPILDAGDYLVGWWRSPNTWGEFSYQSGVGSFLDGTAGGLGNAGGSWQSGNIGRVLAIEPAPITPPAPAPVARVWDGSAWRESDAMVWDGGSWRATNGLVWNGSAWVPTG